MSQLRNAYQCSPSSGSVHCVAAHVAVNTVSYTTMIRPHRIFVAGMLLLLFLGE